HFDPRSSILDPRSSILDPLSLAVLHRVSHKTGGRYHPRGHGGHAMRLILIGPPGSGKGTQAKLLSQRLGLAHIATGDILREAIQLGTASGKKAEPLVKAGQLVPDDVVNDLIADRFRRDDRPEHFLMDG